MGPEFRQESPGALGYYVFLILVELLTLYGLEQSCSSSTGIISSSLWG